MIEPARFFLPQDYHPNAARTTMDAVSGGQYWTNRRVQNAAIFQVPVYKLAIELIRQHGFKSVVDVGCGPATKLEDVHKACPEVAITGIDQPSAIAYCRLTHKFGDWLVDDFESPEADLAGIRGDLVICADVIEHLINPDYLLDYLKGKVSRNGLILLSTPDRDRMLGQGARQPSIPDHVHEWNAQELNAYLKDRGFEIVTHTHQWPWKISLSRPVIRSTVRHLINRVPTTLRYNQAVLMRPVTG
jgi:SAM-dependent methyltransferase